MSRTVPIPLEKIAPVADHEVDPVRRARLLSSHLLFDVLLNTLEEPVELDIRRIPHGILDGRIRVHEARRRGLRTIPALLTIPGTREHLLDIELACLPSWENENENESEQGAGNGTEPPPA